MRYTLARPQRIISDGWLSTLGGLSRVGRPRYIRPSLTTVCRARETLAPRYICIRSSQKLLHTTANATRAPRSFQKSKLALARCGHQTPSLVGFETCHVSITISFTLEAISKLWRNKSAASVIPKGTWV